MSIQQECRLALTALTEATAERIHAHIGREYITLKQVRASLWNLRACGEVVCAKPGGLRRGHGAGRGLMSSTYRLADERDIEGLLRPNLTHEYRPASSSVWDYARQCGQRGA